MKINSIIKGIGLGLIFIVFIIYTIGIVYIHIKYPDKSHFIYGYYTDSYGILAAIGGVLGIYISNQWNGVKSVVGRAITMFSIGLLFQFLGQVGYAWYRYSYGIEDPYPAFPEIFYILSIPIYIYGIWQIALAAGIKFKLKNPLYKLGSALAIGGMMFLSYWLFLSNYDFTDANIIVIFIEFWYPIGQALYVTLAILALILSNKLLGGEMKSKVYFILLAFIVQYIADTYFTIEYNFDAFYPAGTSDYLYVCAYFLMALAIYKFGDLPDKLHQKNLVSKK